MRIISGRYKGRQIPVPSGFNARPTTDFAREGLFNILANRIDFEGLNVLDLFGGTGSISLEFSSRGAGSVDYVETEPSACAFVRITASKLGIGNIRIHRTDAFRFIMQCHQEFDLAFADPPYDLETISEIPGLILTHNILRETGMFILEHGKKYNFSKHPGFREIRKYGSVNFSFFTR